jgi:hypothetical protein
MSDDLHEELKRLRGRRGVERPDLVTQLGPRIAALAGVAPTDRESRVRQAVVARLEDLIRGLPPDLRQAARLAFALDKDHRYPTLDERIGLLAEQQKRSVRTARRLMDQALVAMVRAAESLPELTAEPAAGPGWRMAALRALLRLDTRTPELYEMRTIVATQDIDEVTVRFGLPHAGAEVDGLVVDALFGCRIGSVEHPPDRDDIRVVLKLPHVLRPGEDHEIWLRAVVPPGRPIWPHYAIVPLNPCDAGTVRVRFAPERMPDKVWLLDEVPYLDLDDRTPGPEVIEPTAAGDVLRHFTGLREGYGYGVAWTPIG